MKDFLLYTGLTILVVVITFVDMFAEEKQRVKKFEDDEW